MEQGHPWAAGGGNSPGPFPAGDVDDGVWREGLAWGWLCARCRLGQARVPLATGSPGVIYGRSGVLRSPSPAGSVLRWRWRVGSCR